MAEDSETAVWRAAARLYLGGGAYADVMALFRRRLPDRSEDVLGRMAWAVCRPVPPWQGQAPDKFTTLADHALMAELERDRDLGQLLPPRRVA